MSGDGSGRGTGREALEKETEKRREIYVLKLLERSIH